MKVKFVPQNIECEIKPGQSVLHVAQDNGLYIKSVCRGVPSCAECRVRVVDGDFNVLRPGSAELALIGTGYFVDQRRLSCQLKCFGDITVDLSEQIEKEKKALEKHSRSRAGADEMAISRSAVLAEGGAPLGSDEMTDGEEHLDDGADSIVETEAASGHEVQRAPPVGLPVNRGGGRPQQSARPPQGARPPQSERPAPGAAPSAGPSGEGEGPKKKRRRRGRRGGSGGGGQGPGSGGGGSPQ